MMLGLLNIVPLPDITIRGQHPRCGRQLLRACSPTAAQRCIPAVQLQRRKPRNMSSDLTLGASSTPLCGTHHTPRRALFLSNSKVCCVLFFTLCCILYICIASGKYDCLCQTGRSEFFRNGQASIVLAQKQKQKRKSFILWT